VGGQFGGERPHGAGRAGKCPTRQLLDSVSDKWMGLVLCALGEGAKRHSELARRIAGVSQKMLTQTLRTLERDG
jgi:DNA-binding HxlR family transcriptional regulator